MKKLVVICSSILILAALAFVGPHIYQAYLLRKKNAEAMKQYELRDANHEARDARAMEMKKHDEQLRKNFQNHKTSN